jgi:hypothetical protein
VLRFDAIEWSCFGLKPKMKNCAKKKKLPVSTRQRIVIITPHAQLYKKMEFCFDAVASDSQHFMERSAMRSSALTGGNRSGTQGGSHGEIGG